MVLNFDLRDFLSNCKASKPPYRCPVENCEKTYRSYSGIQQHMQQSHSNEDRKRPVFSSNPNPMFYNDESSDANTGSTHQLFGTRENLTYAEAQRMVEVELDGRVHRINIAERMGIVNMDEIHTDSNGDNSNHCSGKDVNTDLDIQSDELDNEASNQSTCSRKSAKKGRHRRRENSRSGTFSINKKSVPTGQNLQSVVSEPINGTIKLPEPSFRVLNDRQVSRAPPRPLAYFRYIDKSPEELDEQIEYDMDEEDFSWLELINKKRLKDNLATIPPDTFELLMDRLEKECYFMNEKNGNGDYYSSQAIDEDAVCCICNDGECQNSNAILFCDMCDLPVHQECYGVPYIPEGQWLCRRCLQSPSRSVDCILCPNRGGAFKQTDDGRWCHVVCALWVPEVCFSNLVFLEPIDSIDAIPTARWKLICYICKQKNAGACIQCHKSNCYTAFHVTCAQQAGLHMRMEAVRDFNGSTVNTYIRKEAYCDAHMPVGRCVTNDKSHAATSTGSGRNGREAQSDSDQEMDVEVELDESDEQDDSSDADSTDDEDDDEDSNDRSKRRRSNSKHKTETTKKNRRSNGYLSSSNGGFKENKSFEHASLNKKKEIKAKMKKARKILAEKRSACPTVAIPTIPAERLTEIAQLINIPKRNQFLQRLLGYWTLKRESRNGVPLLRRLQLSNGNHLGNQSQRRQRNARTGNNCSEHNVQPEVNEERTANSEETMQLRCELKELQRLRQDLERARILIELIRKREKVKREQIRNLEQQVRLQVQPFKIFLQSVLNLLKAKDTNGFFLEPVDTEEVPDYLYFIKNPMSYADMQDKVDRHEYSSFDEFEADFNQIIDNCTSYNEKQTVYYKAAIKMRDACKNIFKNAREKLAKCGLDEKAGVHLSDQKDDLNEPSAHTAALEDTAPASPANNQSDRKKLTFGSVCEDTDAEPEATERRTMTRKSRAERQQQLDVDALEDGNSQMGCVDSGRKELRSRLVNNHFDELHKSSLTDSASNCDIPVFKLDQSPRRNVSKSNCISPLKMILNKKPDSPLLTLLTQKSKQPPVASRPLSPAPAVKSKRSASKTRPKCSDDAHVKQITSYFQVLSSPNQSNNSRDVRSSDDCEEPLSANSSDFAVFRESQDKDSNTHVNHDSYGNFSVLPNNVSSANSLSLAADANERRRKKRVI